MGGKTGIPGPPGPSVLGVPNSRTIAIGSAYQATNPAKIAMVTINLASTSSNSLLSSTQATQKASVYMSSTAAGVTGATGTPIALHENTQGGVLVAGLTITQTCDQQAIIPLPIGWYFGVLQTVGSNLSVLSAFDQSVG